MRRGGKRRRDRRSAPHAHVGINSFLAADGAAPAGRSGRSERAVKLDCGPRRQTRSGGRSPLSFACGLRRSPRSPPIVMRDVIWGQPSCGEAFLEPLTHGRSNSLLFFSDHKTGDAFVDYLGDGAKPARRRCRPGWRNQPVSQALEWAAWCGLGGTRGSMQSVDHAQLASGPQRIATPPAIQHKIQIKPIKELCQTLDQFTTNNSVAEVMVGHASQAK